MSNVRIQDVVLPGPTGGTLGLKYPASLLDDGVTLYDQKEVRIADCVVGRVVNPRFENGRCVCEIEYTAKEQTMTKERLKYLLDSGILQAAVDGKPLQYRMHDRASWFDIEGFPDFDTAPTEFRVKPKLNVPKVVRFGDLDEKTQDSYLEWVVINAHGKASVEYKADGIPDDATVVLPA